MSWPLRLCPAPGPPPGRPRRAVRSPPATDGCRTRSMMSSMSRSWPRSLAWPVALPLPSVSSAESSPNNGGLRCVARQPPSPGPDAGVRVLMLPDKSDSSRNSPPSPCELWHSVARAPLSVVDASSPSRPIGGSRSEKLMERPPHERRSVARAARRRSRRDSSPTVVLPSPPLDVPPSLASRSWLASSACPSASSSSPPTAPRSLSYSSRSSRRACSRPKNARSWGGNAHVKKVHRYVDRSRP